MQGDEGAGGFGEDRRGIGQSAEFAFRSFGIAGVGADLDELVATIGVAGEEVDFVACEGANPGGGRAAAFEFEEYECLQGVTEVRTTGAFVEGDDFADFLHLTVSIGYSEWQRVFTPGAANTVMRVWA